MDFSNYEFRASQCSKLLVGKIGLTEIEEQEIKNLIQERDFGINANGNKVKWADSKNDKLINLQYIKEHNPLPKTLETELRKIHRSETYGRNFQFTNKYVQKGTDEEDEAITVYQNWRNAKGMKSFFVKNDKRFHTGFFNGEPDLTDTNDIFKCNEGFDTKCSWELDTFPFSGDSLDPIYECQNQVYMNGTGAKKWTTAYVLVNASAELIYREKMKWYYAYGSPIKEGDKLDKYNKAAREVEKRLIFDRDRFDTLNPHVDLEISTKEWHEQGLDIPLEERVVEKVSIYNPDFIEELKDRVVFSRKYLNKLNHG